LFPEVTKNVIGWLPRPPKASERRAISLVAASPGVRAGQGVRDHFSAIMDRHPVRLFETMGIGSYGDKSNEHGNPPTQKPSLILLTSSLVSPNTAQPPATEKWQAGFVRTGPGSTRADCRPGHSGSVGRPQTVENAVVATTDSEILIERSGAVTTITLCRPDALNALTPTMLVALDEAVGAAIDDSTQRVVVLTGTGRAFSAGVDLKALGDRALVNGVVGDILDVPARALTDKLANGSIVSIAKVNGFCFTGALEIALACDIMVVADEATLADTHAKFGLRPTWGMSQRLPAAVGMTKARELSLTARNVRGPEAAAIGLAARSVPRDELDTTVDELVGVIVSNSSGSLAAYKDLFQVAEQKGLTEGLVYEASTGYLIDDTDERLAAFR
jgi:enoyl-CoA hydratase